jgi:SAM-dependent methyltransferase
LHEGESEGDGLIASRRLSGQLLWFHLSIFSMLLDMTSPVTQVDIANEFERRKPWVTKFLIQGGEYGGHFDAINDDRVIQFFQYFPDASTILELGALEGGHSFALASRPVVKRVVATEGRASNIEKALFVQKLFGADKVEFVEANLENFDLPALGTFDAVFCSGLLYHLPEPWKLIEQCAKVSPNVFMWTHYAGENEAEEKVHGLRGKWHQEGGLLDPLSGLSKKSFWPTMGSLISMLTASGFRTVHLIGNELTHRNGLAVTLAATQG